jgi:hypothetical protein
MRRADIEVPNLAVAMDAWARPACYPRGNFYPLNKSASTRYLRVTMPHFRDCSTCQSCSKADLYHYALQLISIQLESTFGILRYFLVRNRPSQTAHQTLSPTPIRGWDKKQHTQREVLHWRLHPLWRAGFKVSLLHSTMKALIQCQATVKIPGSFCPGAGRPHLHSHFNVRRVPC